MDLSAKIKDLKIDPAWTNASGIFSFPHILKRISEYDIGAVVTKSIGKESREGFMEPILVKATDETYINAVGLSNPGYKLMRDELKEIYPLSKPLICSVFGGNEEEFKEVANGLEDYCDAIELNFSCPNLREGEKIGITIGRDSDLVRRYTEAVKDVVKKPVIVKLTPNVDNIGKIAKAAEDAGADAISAINTVSPGMKIDIYARRPVLTNKFGGVSGPGIKPEGVASVYKIYENVDIPIIGMGGIRLSSTEDFFEYIEAGAVACGIGTAFADKDNKQVKRSLKRFRMKIEKTLEKLGASSLKELVGVAHGV